MSVALGDLVPKRRRSLDSDVLRVAIVGGGPRGLHCLECLAQEFARLPATRRKLEVIVYEPTQHLGAGNVYAPDQPRHLRMNFAACKVNAWSHSPEARPDRGDAKRVKTDRVDLDRVDLVQWLQQYHPELADPAGYIARGVVGEYLSHCFRQLVDDLPSGMVCQVVHARVLDVRALETAWQIVAPDHTKTFDEVVITTGHEGWRSSRNAVEKWNAENTIPHIYPVDQQLDSQHIPPHVNVACRGFGLTWIDAALSLTEGRSGRFEQTSHGWDYLPSGREPAKLFPFSRSGRPMLAKPQSHPEFPPDFFQRELASTITRLNTLSRPDDGFQFERDLFQHVLAAGDLLLQSVRVEGDCAAWFSAWCRQPFDAQQVLRWMQTSHAVAIGDAPPDEAWALGHAWRELYPALVTLLNHGGLTTHSWRDFYRLSGEMERIAFGPPAENMGRILSLIQAGVVDLQFVVSPQLRQRQSGLQLVSGKEVVNVDRLIEATIPAAGEFAADSLFGKLLQRGVLRRQAGTQGIEIDPAGRPVGREGTGTQGLAVLGRATEGCVVGNDTLSRRLHSHAARWAASVASRLHGSRTLPETVLGEPSGTTAPANLSITTESWINR